MVRSAADFAERNTERAVHATHTRLGPPRKKCGAASRSHYYGIHPFFDFAWPSFDRLQRAIGAE
jgi:hypothetical protein